MKILFRSLVAAALMAGASTVGAAAPAGAIYNGLGIMTAPPWAAYVTVVGSFAGLQWEQHACTGSIISNAWVLTAAHCVMEEDAQGHVTSNRIPTAAFRVVLGRSDLTKTYQGGQWTLDNILVDPAFKAAGLPGDLALLQLHGGLPSSARPLPLAPSGFAPPDGQGMTAFGYGNTSETYKPGDPTKVATQTESAYLRETKAGSYVASMSCTTPWDWCMQRVGASMTLHGDSGGPWVTSPSSPFIVGVHSVDGGFSNGSWSVAGAAKVTLAAAHDWITSSTGILQGAVGRIYRNPYTGASWLFEGDGFRHSIPDGGTYLCLTAQGHAVTNLSDFVTDELPLSSTNAVCGSGIGPHTSVLVFGGGDANQENLDNIATTLTGAGYTVTEELGTTLPDDISKFGQIWWSNAYSGLSSADEARLETFVQDGGGLFLTGEWGGVVDSCCIELNQSDLRILTALVPGESLTMPADDALGSQMPVNASVLYGVASRPNVLTTWTGSAVGGIAGVPSANTLVANGPDAAGAVWELPGGGRIAILMDVNWTEAEFGDPATMPLMIQNLGRFLSGAS